jgi:UDP-N-acetylglucosamine 2-epimerase (non-hydrolysing)
MKPKIHLVVGARPNFIKASPVYRSLNQLNKFELKLVNTGQHYDQNMSSIFIQELRMKEPDINLEVRSGLHGEQTGKILSLYEKVLIKDKPNMVIVFGDVNSTIACSLAAAKLGIPIAHVESGLRSFDWKMPEEINRVLTDRLSTFLFTTSPEAKDNLINEGISIEKIHFVGNTMIDSLIEFQDKFEKSNVRENLDIQGDYALITLHRPSNVDNGNNLKKLINSIQNTSKIIPCIFPIHPRTKKKLQSAKLYNELLNNKRIKLIDPMGYIDFMCLQMNARIVLTDSGGIQEETTFFGVSCITVRENTERPITISNGTNKLIGAEYDKIPEEIEDTIKDKCDKYSIPTLWDGNSAGRISKILDLYFFD